jgi:putative tryptophan/tyrosine transport system substrate-binding protein
MRRRDFISLVGGSAVAWPLAARAQQADRVRRIGVLSPLAENDPAGRKRMAAFLRALQKLGWREGDNLRIDYRYAFGVLDDAYDWLCRRRREYSAV